jgi:hypothetical protein
MASSITSSKGAAPQHDTWHDHDMLSVSGLAVGLALHVHASAFLLVYWRLEEAGCNQQHQTPAASDLAAGSSKQIQQLGIGSGYLWLTVFSDSF